jgi:vesicle coat complex subunit
MVMDFLRILAAPSLEVRRKTLDMVLDLASSRNISETVAFLVKELAKTNRSASALFLILIRCSTHAAHVCNGVQPG